MSRAELARALGVNRSTTGSIITNLQADALVVEQAALKRTQPAARTGRPDIEIELNPMGAHFIGAAIEADRLIAVMIDLSGAIVRRKTAPFHAARHDPAKAAQAVAKLINALVAAEPTRTRILGACVAVPAMFDDGIILQATLLGWRDVDLRPLIAAHLAQDWPVSVENDVNAFAVAETYRGASPPAATVAFMLIDSGAGGAIVNGGRLLRGGFGLLSAPRDLAVARLQAAGLRISVSMVDGRARAGRHRRCRSRRRVGRRDRMRSAPPTPMRACTDRSRATADCAPT